MCTVYAGRELITLTVLAIETVHKERLDRAGALLPLLLVELAYFVDQLDPVSTNAQPLLCATCP
jgi:hypothetical protein